MEENLFHLTNVPLINSMLFYCLLIVLSFRFNLISISKDLSESHTNTLSFIPEALFFLSGCYCDFCFNIRFVAKKSRGKQ